MLGSRMGIPLYCTGDMACSKPEGVADRLVCDSDIYGVETPAEYIKEMIVQHDDIVHAVKTIHETVRGGYACAWKTNDHTYLFRDLIGLKPLYYQGKTFASEKKAFLTMPHVLLPGELVKLPHTTLCCTKIEPATPPTTRDMLDALQESAQQQIGPSAALLFSGGVDSSILAQLSDAALITCGLEGSQDLVFSRKAARSLKKELVEVVISEKEIKNAIPHVLSLIDEKTLLNVEIGLLIFFVCQESDKDVLISGQGADELFGGYYKYEKAYQQKAEVKVLMRKDVDALYHGLERDSQVAEHFDKRIRYPYLDVDVVRKALGIPTEILFTPQRKGFLRTVAEQLSVPEDIVVRPKKALQYGTGIHKIVRKYINDIKSAE